MTRARTPKPTAPPLAVTIRQALASDWRTLAALDVLAGGARGSDARRLVHEALRVLRGEGAVLEERVGKAGVEVRLLTLPAPVPDDGRGVEDDSDGAAYCDEIAPLSPAASARMADLIEHPPAPSEALRALCRGENEPDDYTRFHAALAAGVEGLDASAPPVGQAAPAEAVGWPVARDRCATCDVPHGNHAPHDGHAFAPREPTDPHFVECRRCKADPGHPCKGDGAPHAERAVDAEAWARVQDGLPPAPKGPGPSSRCAVCGGYYSRHADCSASPAGHPFTPNPRGRPPAPASKQPPIPNAAPAILPRVRQRRTPGPVVDVDGGRVERATPSEQAAILAGMREQWDAAVAEHRAEREGAEPETSRGRSDAQVLYSAIKAAGLTHVALADGSAGNASAAPVYMATNAGPRCPSVWRDVRCEREAGHPCGSADDPGRHHETANRDAIWTDEAAARWARLAEEVRETSRGVKAKRATVMAPPPCRPPLCYRDDIHEPARVRGFARPLCEAHRAWVEGAGGTLWSCSHQWDDRLSSRKCMFCGVEQSTVTTETTE